MKRYLKKVVFCTEDRPWQIDGANQEALYIVDTEQRLKLIKSMGLPVVVWLHGGNKEQSFYGAAYAVEEPLELDMDFYERVYRREKGIPWEILETERCLVREMIPEDAAAFAEIYKDSVILKYMKDFHNDAAGEADYIREYQQHYRFYEYGVWSIVLKETGEVIGRAGFSEPDFGGENGRILPDKSAAETENGMYADGLPCLGYMIGAPWQGQGLAFEVCKAILNYAKEELGFEAVRLWVEEDNEASIALSSKLGFVDDCTAGDGCGCQVRRKVISWR